MSHIRWVNLKNIYIKFVKVFLVLKTMEQNKEVNQRPNKKTFKKGRNRLVYDVKI